jgi:membrane-associated protease RseP (regulator of RpoE activity)
VDHVLLYAIGVILFVAGVALSIGLHEFGHLVPGKLFNVKVTQYFIGFGKTLWSTRRGETEYGVKAIPLGGYVKLVGMLPPAEGDVDASGEEVATRPTGMFAQLVSDAKRAEYEHVDPHDHHRLFYRQPVWKRIVIMVSGVATNLVLSFMLFAIVFMGIGIYGASTTVGSVDQCMKVVAAGTAPGQCGVNDPETPAYKAGLRPGDKVLAFNGTAISSYSQLQNLIRAYSGAKATTMVVQRGDKQLSLAISPTEQSLPSLTDPSKKVEAHFIGITADTERQTQSAGYVLSTMFDQTRATLSALGHLPQRVYHVARAAIGLEKRDPNSLMSVVGAGRVAGEVASHQGASVTDKLSALLLILAGLNLFLGLVNLVPLPPFDGAGVATALVEAVRSRWARFRGRPDPGVIDAGKLLPLTYGVAILLLAISVVLIYADIVAPVSIS